ncbi:hypothetical protein C7R54_15725 [Achromobacter aloeverae]|uniref:Uncharacterized protein n=1 Tax=Achromobacter aloeverae TaxID=1750518 RepID=A0A4Q1HIH5_9BURK|nr:hypothetical protein C7R54_15725 [Achromobacter aloeverae]
MGQFASTTSAQLAGIISDKTGSGSLVFGSAPMLTTPNIVGSGNGSNAAAGSVGEFLSVSVASGSAVSLTSNTAATIATLSLSPGDWDVWGNIWTAPAGTTAQTLTVAGINIAASLPTAPGNGALVQYPFSVAAGAAIGAPVGTVRINISTATTVYLVCLSQFASGTNGAYGFLGARRRR